MSEIDPIALDFADYFSGAVRPKETVQVFLNEVAAKNRAKIKATIDEFEKQKLDTDDLQKELAKADEALRASRMEVYITGASREDIQLLVEANEAKYPAEHDLLGRVKENREAIEDLTNEMWALHIEKMVTADGRTLLNPPVSQIALFRKQAPQHAIDTIEDAIDKMRRDTYEGFESAILDPDFLSQP